MKIDKNDKIPGCENFYWYEFLKLNQWGVYVLPENDKIYENILKTAELLQKIRKILGSAMYITSGYRPKSYNKLIGGAFHSAHVEGLACDFVVKGYQGVNGCKEVRKKLLPFINELEFRIEKHDGNWIHVDLRYNKNGNNYFYP